MFKFQHNGKIQMDVLVLIPFLLYVSRSVISNPKRKTRAGHLYSLHVTPFLAIGLALNCKHNYEENESE